MSLRVLEWGRRGVLGSWLGLAPPPPGFLLRLFKTNISPSQADPASLYLTNEADFTGYMGQIIPGWNPITEFMSIAKSQAFPVVFFCDTPLLVGNQIYGYFVSPTNNLARVLWAERFTIAPVAMTLAGEALLVIASYSEQSIAT